MKKILFFLLLELFTSSSFADLQLDTSQNPKIISQNLEPFFNADAVWPYTDVSSPEIKRIKERWEGAMAFNYFGGSQFAWIYNDRTYFSSLVSFERKEAIKLENQDIAQLFMFNPDRTIGAIGFLKIKKNKQVKGQPHFLQVKAMGIAKIVPDAMLLTIEYYDSAKYFADPNNDFPVHTTTLLVRFHNINGKFKLEQDDNCVGNPNSYKTIAAARKALAQCVGVPK